MSYPLRRPIALLAVVLAVLCWPAAARACSIDGIVSLSANGNLANLTGGAATRANIAHWAPFSFIAAAVGNTLHLREDLGELHRTLPESAFKTPFRWSFGDGTVATGWSPSHRYSRLGTYKITVSYYWPERQRWVVFDNVEQPIVAAGDLWRVNLGYYVGKFFLIAMRVSIWLTLIAVVGIVIWRRLRPSGRRSRTKRHVAW